MIEVEVALITIDLTQNAPVVFLREKEGEPKRLLPIWVGFPEAQAIHYKIQNAKLPRPMTHDLMNNIIDNLGAKVTSVAVVSIEETTFYGRINLSIDGKELDIDSRPSDAIALALRAGASIYVAEEVMEESGFSEDELKELEENRYKNVLENLDDDILGKYKV